MGSVVVSTCITFQDGCRTLTLLSICSTAKMWETCTFGIIFLSPYWRGRGFAAMLHGWPMRSLSALLFSVSRPTVLSSVGLDGRHHGRSASTFGTPIVALQVACFVVSGLFFHYYYGCAYMRVTLLVVVFDVWQFTMAMRNNPFGKMD